MVDPSKTSVTIVGAGIVGLTAALQLHASGFRDIHIFEKVRELQPLGVGISIQPGAALVLRNLGLEPALDRMAVRGQYSRLLDQFGNYIVDLPMGEASGSTVPGFMIHRGKLQMMLYDAVRERLGEGCVHLDHAIDRFEENGPKIVAHFASRTQSSTTITSRESDLLLGADGIGSAIRSRLYPDEGPPIFGGMSIWRGAVWTDLPIESDTLCFQGHSDHWFLTYAISPRDEQGKILLNWVGVLRTRARDDPDKTPPAVVSWDLKAPKDELIKQFEGWSFGTVTVRDIVESSDPIWVYPMVDRDPVSRWSFGKLTLIGDAAHPMYPLGGNGATQGVLDTACLSRHLLQAEDVPSALKAYEAERVPTTSAIVNANRGSKGIHSISDMVRERAPNGFQNIRDVISEEEIHEVAYGYYKATGNHASIVNKQALDTEGTAERLHLSPPQAWVSA